MAIEPKNGRATKRPAHPVHYTYWVKFLTQAKQITNCAPPPLLSCFARLNRGRNQLRGYQPRLTDGNRETSARHGGGDCCREFE
jgi:hypothetical protein